MSADLSAGPRIPLVPLPDIVHFPCTDLKLQILEPYYQRMMRDLVEHVDEDDRQIGLVLLKPAGWIRDPEPDLEFFRAGTLARLLDVELWADGRVDLWLHGEQRFELTEAWHGGTCRRAVVRLLEEPLVNENDAGIVAVRGSILELARSLSGALGESFPVPVDEIDELSSTDCRFEEVVNRIAADLDLPALRKLELLVETLPERGLSMLSILKNRHQVVDLLRPFRHLAGSPDSN